MGSKTKTIFILLIISAGITWLVLDEFLLRSAFLSTIIFIAILFSLLSIFVKTHKVKKMNKFHEFNGWFIRYLSKRKDYNIERAPAMTFEAAVKERKDYRIEFRNYVVWRSMGEGLKMLGPVAARGAIGGIKEANYQFDREIDDYLSKKPTFRNGFFYYRAIMVFDQPPLDLYFEVITTKERTAYKGEKEITKILKKAKKELIKSDIYKVEAKGGDIFFHMKTKEKSDEKLARQIELVEKLSKKLVEKIREF